MDLTENRFGMILPLIIRALKNSGGGSGGTTNYNNLTNKPSINGVELSGNKTSDDLGISGMTEEQEEQLNQATEDILTKVDKDQGTENAGKVLGIGSDGMVTPVDGMGGGPGGTTNYNDLTNKPTINGVTLEGNKTSADLDIQSQTTQTDHGAADTTFTLPANQYHTWGEVAALTLTLAAEESGVVNEYHFAFDSGDTATTLSLPEGIQTDIVVEPNTHYECSIIDNYMTFRDWPVEVSA